MFSRCKKNLLAQGSRIRLTERVHVLLSTRNHLADVVDNEVRSDSSKYSTNGGWTDMSDSPGEPRIRRRLASAVDAEKPSRRLSHFTPPDHTEESAGATSSSPVAEAAEIPAWGQLVELKRVQDAILDASPSGSLEDNEARNGSPKPTSRSGKLNWQKLQNEVKKEKSCWSQIERPTRDTLSMLSGKSVSAQITIVQGFQE